MPTHLIRHIDGQIYILEHKYHILMLLKDFGFCKAYIILYLYFKCTPKSVILELKIYLNVCFLKK